MSSKIHWRTLLRLIGKCPLPVHQGAWNFPQSFLNVYSCQSWHSKSSKLHWGIKNVIQDSLEDALDTQWGMGNVIPSRFLGGRSGDAKEIILFQCTEGPEISYRASLMFMHDILDIHSLLYSITPFRSQEYPPRLLGGRSGDAKDIILFLEGSSGSPQPR